MKDLLELIVKSIVDQQDKVEIEESSDNEGLILNVKVASEDIGKVIGKQGKTANAIRTIVKAKAFNEGKKVFVHIVE